VRKVYHGAGRWIMEKWMKQSSQDIPSWIGIFLPLALCAVYVLLLPYDSRLLDWSGGRLGMRGEFGMLESAQVIVLVFALFFAIRLSALPAAHQVRGFRWWTVLLLLGCVYILGEEISWGQHYVGWESSEWFKRHNLQGEMNIHNLHSGWLIFKPRILLELLILLGSILYPLWRKFHGRPMVSDASPAAWFWPTPVCVWSAVLVLGVSNLKRFDNYFRLDLVGHITLDYSELRELAIYLFLLLYLWSICRRLRPHRSASVA